MNFIEQLWERAKAKKKHIIFPEAADPRVLQAASFLVEKNICRISLIGDPEGISSQIDDSYANLSNIDILDPFDDLNLETYIHQFHQRRKHKRPALEEARRLLSGPLYFGAALVAAEEADGCVAGAVFTTSDVLRAAIRVIGLREDISVVSGIFLMAMPDGNVFTYGDCAVVPYPDAEQLADIAIESARSHRLLTGQEPRVAMLSFSTKGSAEHESVSLVKKALEIAKAKSPGLHIDGELQFDAAFVPEIAKSKAPGSEVAGKANVFIFPNLDAGNIAYKITERMGGASATGPIIQGLARPMMDLSRGCSWKDIVNAACVSILMGEDKKQA